METITDRGVQDVEALAPAPSNLVEAFRASAARRGQGPALRAGVEGEWISWVQWAAASERAARAFAALGVRRGDTAALMLRNRPEFHVLDIALLMLGAIPFSIYNTSSPPQIASLLRESGARVVVAEADLAAAVSHAAPDEIQVFSIDGPVDRVPAWAAALEDGDPALDIRGLALETSPDDIATIIYTSGTTGPPKGVQLTHANLIWMARILPVWWRLDDQQSLISYLPMAHVAERIFTYYMPVVWGWPVSSCAEARTVGAMLAPVQPSIFFAPPRFWEKLQAAALAGPLGTEEMQAALARGIELVRAQQRGAPDSRSEQELRDKFAPIRRAFGLDGLQCAMISAASVPPPLVEFWRALGVPLVEGYGLSEASAGVCFDDRFDPRIGTVGPPLPGVEVMLAPDGELLVRSPSVMVGYRGEPQQTAEALDEDGWLHTGDIATIDDDGRVRIVDRKKELIINAAGKNMSPANIEGELKSASPLIAQAICIGEARPYNVALLVLDPDAAGMPVAQAAHDQSVKTRVAEAVASANANLSRVEQIKRYAILDVDWLPDSDELTPTMKLKRKPIAATSAGAIEALYI
ncbi:MAG: AMP-dependent synthetase/ligase [Solirubrobacteraceae bacterium]